MPNSEKLKLFCLPWLYFYRRSYSLEGALLPSRCCHFFQFSITTDTFFLNFHIVSVSLNFYWACARSTSFEVRVSIHFNSLQTIFFFISKFNRQLVHQSYDLFCTSYASLHLNYSSWSEFMLFNIKPISYRN